MTPKVKLGINVDQTEPGNITLASRLLGTQPYVVVELGADETGALVVRADIAGPETDIEQIGWALKMLGSAIEKQGAALTAKAMASGDRIAVATMKGSEL